MDKENKNCSSLDKSELFAGLPSSVFKEVIASARPKDFASSDVMFFVDDPIRQVLLLTEGLVKKSQLSQGGREAILRLIVPGEVISETALVPGGTHSSTAQALQDCKVLAWDSAAFEAASVCFPGLRKNAHRILERASSGTRTPLFRGIHKKGLATACNWPGSFDGSFGTES